MKSQFRTLKTFTLIVIVEQHTTFKIIIKYALECESTHQFQIGLQQNMVI